MDRVSDIQHRRDDTDTGTKTGCLADHRALEREWAEVWLPGVGAVVSRIAAAWMWFFSFLLRVSAAAAATVASDDP